MKTFRVPINSVTGSIEETLTREDNFTNNKRVKDPWNEM
jgi:hypothetical protein